MAKRGRKPSGQKTLEQKVKDQDSSFVDEVRLLTPDQLKERMVKLTQYEVDLVQARRDDVELLSLKEKTAEASATYSEPLKANKLKREFLLQVLREKGSMGTKA